VSRTPWPVDPFEVARLGTPREPAGAPWERGTGHGGRSGGGSEISQLARGGTLALIGSAASSVLGFALIVVLTRGLGSPRAAGVALEAMTLFLILTNAAELGADTGLVRMVAGYRATHQARDIPRTLSVALWPVVVVSTLAGAAVYVFAPQLSHVFITDASRADAVTYLRIFAPFIPLATLTTVVLAATRGFGTMVPYVGVWNIGLPLVRPVAIGAVLALGMGVTAVALAWGIPAAVGLVISLAALRRYLRRTERREFAWSAPARPVRELRREFWRFTAARGLAGFMQITIIQINVLLVGALATTSDAGVFAAVSRFVGVGTFALQAVGIALAPQIASLMAQGERRKAERVFQTGTWWLMALGWPMYVVMAVFAPFLLRVFGHEYVRGSAALVILSIGMLIFVGTGNNKIVLLMGGGSGWNLVITSTTLVVDVALNVLLIPVMGIEGAAVALTATILVDNVATTLVVWRKLHVSPFGVGYPVVVLGSLLCFGALGAAVRVELGMTLKSFAGFALVSCLLYLGVLWRFRNVLRLSALKAAVRMRGGGRGGGWRGPSSGDGRGRPMGGPLADPAATAGAAVPQP
jgi:O-antigen/teichoic acid export membrane protein